MEGKREMSYTVEKEIEIRYKKEVTYPIIHYEVITEDTCKKKKSYIEKNGYEIYQEKEIPLATREDGTYAQLYYRMKGDKYYQRIGNQDQIRGGGYRDPVCFVFRSKTYILSNGISKGKERTKTMNLICLESRTEHELNIENVDMRKTRMNRKWVPYVKDEKLYFIYSYDELCILEYIDKGRCIVKKGNPYNNNQIGEYVGNTGLVGYRGEYLGIVKSKTGIKGIRYDGKIVTWTGKEMKFTHPEEEKEILRLEADDMETKDDMVMIVLNYDEKKSVKVWLNINDVFY